MPYRKQRLLPMIVTTARIYSCDFDPADVDPRTGEIPYDRVSIEELPHVLYEYPLPRSLQRSPADLAATILSNSMEIFVRMHILVVHSEAFKDFLADLAVVAPEPLQ
jgi:hypothetical protein